ncbi:hypothetical protein M406DRAFT_358201 [Cryphonectria parasitica EP155]|uniref:Uncharacterized protein n=1 Tax=Cryphonectria parasitica (strain ATCC 38755 / EP155) TaxID=660469 RepID=A0A9P5CI32_CRYP1|nr:uncharacterized protein M406DRAFT_358201 [Cryphonectria parasitica EP155]KAF3760489.1 hypothetical protein M406DRAFT_358201 [Cryphonectria parasitica EP155]
MASNRESRGDLYLSPLCLGNEKSQEQHSLRRFESPKIAYGWCLRLLRDRILLRIFPLFSRARVKVGCEADSARASQYLA